MSRRWTHEDLVRDASSRVPADAHRRLGVQGDVVSAEFAGRCADQWMETKKD